MKKITSLFLVLTLGISLLVPAFAASGQGTCDNPYLISSAEDLSNIRNDLQGYYKLTADIDLSGVAIAPIGNEVDGAFGGTIDGDGHTIRNLSMDLASTKYVGLVGYLEGTIKNLIIESASVCGYRYVGVLAGYLAEGGEIIACTTSGSVNAAIKNSNICPNAGGIVGYQFGGSVTDCVNRCTVFASSLPYYTMCASGGIVGYMTYGSVVNCINSGDVSAQGSPLESGGITGHIESGTVTNCVNFGIVHVNQDDNTNYSGVIGGIAGTSSYGVNTSCVNNGYVMNDAGSVGGIVGINEVGSIVQNCVNSGMICGSVAGGIVAVNKYSGLIDTCYNDGSISAYSNHGDTYAGGIVAICNGTVEDCVNSGGVSSISVTKTYNRYAYGGGIIGGKNSTNINQKCENSLNYGVISAMMADSPSRCGTILGEYYPYNNNYSIYEANNAYNNLYGALLLSDQFRLQESFSNLDFENTWYIDSNTNSGFPQLRHLPIHLRLSESALQLAVGKTTRLTAAWESEYIPVSWSSEDTKVVTVASDGTVFAKGTGICTVTATAANGYKANCCIRVYEEATSAKLNDSTITLPVGDAYTLVCTQKPDSANGIVMWTSDNEDVAAVDPVSGRVDARKSGTALVTATLLGSGITSTCQVTVVPGAVKTISLSPTTAKMKVGESQSITVTVNPEGSGPLIWKSTDESVATVENSVISAVGPGTTVISVESESGVSASCTVTVAAPITDIRFVEGSITLEKTLSTQLKLDYAPLNTTDRITFSSSNNNVTVGDSGVVTANKVGTSVISANASSGKKAYCTVTVIDQTIPVAIVSLDCNEMIMTRTEKRQLDATVSPIDATDRNLSWISADENVATVSDTGVVTAIGEGVTVIRAESNNGMYDACIISVVSASGPSIVLNATEGAPGMTVEVNASIVQNPGISAYRFNVNYDSNLLTPIAITPNQTFGGTFETNLTDDNQAELYVLWYKSGDVNISDHLFTVEFIVADNVLTDSKTSVTLSCNPQDICNVNGDHVALYQQSAEISIHAPLWGDVFGDGEISVYDLTLLTRYITGLEHFSRRQMEIADIYTDGEIDIRDVVKLAQTLVQSKRNAPIRLFMANQNVSSESMPVLTVGGAIADGSGEVSIPVSISNNPGISGFRYIIEYDCEALEITQITPRNNLATNFTTNLGTNEDGRVIATWYDTDNTKDSGELFYIKAKMKASVTESISIGIQQAVNNMCDEELAYVPASYETGELYTKSPVENGDCNGDNEVDLRDMACLFTFLSTGENEGTLKEWLLRFAADVDNNGYVNILDYQSLYEMLRK